MTGLIILAAGSSSRMGKAKQNLPYKSRTLLQTVVNTALQCNCEAVAVVLGAYATEIVPTISNQPVNIFMNDNWKDGMGTSISCGLRELLTLYPDLNNVIFLLADQPFTNTNIIKTLITKSEQGKIIASLYNNTLGPPILFDKAFFSSLLLSRGNEGAKKIINKHPDAVISIPFDGGAFDIDTPEDYNRLVNVN